MIINPYILVGGTSYDADAQAFITAAGITDNTQKSAVNQLVIDLKAASLWSLLLAAYPFVGGTASSHKWNLKNPLDTDAAFRLSFGGGWTHTASGAKPNGSTGYANTFFNPTTELADNGHSQGAYLTTPSTLSGDKYILGAHTGGSNFQALVVDNATDVYDISFSNATRRGITTANISGLYQGISDTTDHTLVHASTAQSAVATSGNRANADMYIGALNLSGIYGPVDATFGWAHLGLSMTSAQALDLNAVIEAYQTALSRQV